MIRKNFYVHIFFLNHDNPCESLGVLTLAKHPQNFGYNRNNKVIFLEFLPKIEN